MHKRYGKDGLVCLSVSVDVPENKDAAQAFLKAKGASFANYLLDERTSFWQEKLGIAGPPAVYVFNRDGKWVRFDHDERSYTYADVEKLASQWLRE